MNNTKTSSLHTNMIFNIIYQAITVASPIVVTPIISRAFGVSYLGLKSYTFSIVYYFAIFGVLGLDMYGQRTIALQKDDVQSRSYSFFTIFNARFILVFISTVLYVLFIIISGVEGIERIVFICWIVYLIREMINPIWFLQGMEMYTFLSVLGILSQLFYMVSTVLFVHSKDDLPLYILFYTVIPLFISLLYFPVVFRQVHFCRVKLQDIYIAVKHSVVYFVPTVAIAVYSMVDKTMLGLYDPQKISTGLYEASDRLVKVALALSTASFTIMRTRMSYLHGNGDSTIYQITSKKFMAFSLMLCWPIMFGIIGISRDFVPIFFGDGFEDVIYLSCVFSIVVPCLTISGLLQAIYIFPYGMQKTMDFYYCIIVGVNIVMNVFLIYLLGTLGAIIASIVAEMMLAIILLIRAKRDIEVEFIFFGSIKYVIASLTMLFFMHIISQYSVLPIIIKLIFKFLTAVIVYFVSCLILQDWFVKSQFKRAIDIVYRMIIRE